MVGYESPDTTIRLLSLWSKFESWGRKVSQSFRLCIFSIKRTGCSNDDAFGGRCWGQSFKSRHKGEVPGDNGLHMGSTRQVSHNEIVLITVRHPKQKSEIAVMLECQLTSSTFVGFFCQVSHERPVVDPEER